jgi:hypothetical protein
VRGVKSSRAVKFLALAVLLAISLGWKVVARATPSERPSERSIQARVAEFLAQQHFTVTVMERAEEGKPAVSASAGLCRLLIIRSPALGWDRDLVRRYADEGDRVFVVFKGQVFADQPTFQTVFDALSSRFLRELGFKAWPNPVFAVIAKPGCEADRLPWGKV